MRGGVIREAAAHDKQEVLDFCRHTFSWGDYIHHVWDLWLAEGLLYVYDDGGPVALSHTSHSCNQTWVEGIRVHPEFRNRGIASGMVSHAEGAGRRNGSQSLLMAIETGNAPSLLMAWRMGYGVVGTWRFYTMLPKPRHTTARLAGPAAPGIPFYVRSWRWLPTSDAGPAHLGSDGGVVRPASGSPSSAVMAVSDHFEKTMIVTVSGGSDNDILQLLSFVQNHAHAKNYQHVQIMTMHDLPEFDTLEYRYRFYLVRKHLGRSPPRPSG